MSGTKVLWGQIIAIGLILLLSLWAATEWTAWRLDWQSQLGHPWCRLFGWPIYSPPSFFGWWLVFDAYAPRIFLTGAGIFVSGAAGAIGLAFTLSIARAQEARHVTTYGSARWALSDDV